MTELAVQQPTDLAVREDQTTFTPQQREALAHIGVEGASDGDLAVFFHVVKRTGLDPFARQIYMIGRQSSEKNANGGWDKVTKQTIQTGIDGYRLIGHRAAGRARETVSVEAPEWAHEDGSWRPVWRSAWGVPIGARITVRRAGQPFTSVALFDEYKQTKRDGTLTQMWAQRPAGQIAKCAEALAWRMAFPHDLSGIYTEDEMAHAASDTAPVASSIPSGSDRLRAALGAPDSPPPPEEPVKATAERVPTSITSSQLTALNAALTSDLGFTDRDDKIAFLCGELGREITSSKDVTKAEASRLLDRLTTERNARTDAEPTLPGADQ